MVICPNCGAKNEEGEILCGECGARLKGPAKTPKPVVPAEPMKFVEVSAPERKPGTVDPVVTPDRKSVTSVSETPEAGKTVPATETLKCADAVTGQEKKRIPSGVIIAVLLILGVFLAADIPKVVFVRTNIPTGIILKSFSGLVEIYNKDGSEVKAGYGVEIRDGGGVKTDKYGGATFSLGEDRTLQILANCEFEAYKSEDKEREDLRVVLKHCAMFFDIDAPYSGTETMELEAGAVTVNVSKASGYIFFDGKREVIIWVMDGEIDICLADPDSGESIRETLTPGDRASCTFGEDGMNLTTERPSADELPIAMVREIAERPYLMDSVSPDSGWDMDHLIELAEKYKAEDNQLNYVYIPWMFMEDTGAESD